MLPRGTPRRCFIHHQHYPDQTISRVNQYLTYISSTSLCHGLQFPAFHLHPAFPHPLDFIHPQAQASISQLVTIHPQLVFIRPLAQASPSQLDTHLPLVLILPLVQALLSHPVCIHFQLGSIQPQALVSLHQLAHHLQPVFIRPLARVSLSQLVTRIQLGFILTLAPV